MLASRGALHQMPFMDTSSRRILLASIHDVSPRFESEVDGLLELLEPHVGRRLAMLVVPNHWGSAPIVPGSPFATRLRGWADGGIEIFLHGYFHRDDSGQAGAADRLRARFMTAGESEYLGLPKGEAVARVSKGRSLVEEVIGRPVDGFIAPAWLYGRGALDALRESEITICEDHMRVWSPASGQTLARGPVITWASRSRLRLASSLAAAAVLRTIPARVLRVGVHPPDVHHAALVRSIRHTLSVGAEGRTPARYSDLIAT